MGRTRRNSGAPAAPSAPHDAPGAVVAAYEADTIDPVTRLGRSVVVTAHAGLVPDSDDSTCYAEPL